MAHFFDFAVIRLAPGDARDERLNIGALVFKPDGIDVRLPRRLEKIRAISAAVDADTLRALAQQLASLDEHARSCGVMGSAARHEMLMDVGPLNLSPLGTLQVVDDAQYEARIETLLRELVDPEPAPKRMMLKRSKLLTQVKKAFSAYRVLARRDEPLESHRIVTKYEVGEGMVADLVLKNGVYHVAETVDVSREDEPLRKAIGEIGVSALTLQSARLRFGTQDTKARLVYSASASAERHAQAALNAAESQGCELINWQSASDRDRFVEGLAQLATPLPGRRSNQARAGVNLRLI